MAKKQYGLTKWEDRKIYPLTTKEYKKVGNRWVKVKESKKTISEKQYGYTFDDDTLKFFRRLGGYERNDKTYTKFGYRAYKNTSISPDRKTKIIREVDYKKAEKNENRKKKI